MKRTIAVIMLAGASTLAHAQWTGQAQTVETYTWGTPVPQKQVPKHPRPTYIHPLPPAGPATWVPGGVGMDLRTGQIYPQVGPNTYLTPTGVVPRY